MQLKTLQPIICHSSVYSDCKDALTLGQIASGVYIIKPDNKSAFQAYCDMDTDGGGWTVFQRREDGSVDFYCHWTEYQQGFGNLSGVFWLGLEKIHRLTPTATHLRVDFRTLKETHCMHNTQISLLVIQTLDTLCQYQDTVELQEILLVQIQV